MKNREIKFRGKSKTTNKWHYGGLVISENETWIFFGWVGQWQCIEVLPETVGQFTGVMDKSGRELYEGDIFHLGDPNIKYIIEWLDCGFKGRQITNKSCVGIEHWANRIEIISTIHDTKN